jgi:hypothetical protein
MSYYLIATIFLTSGILLGYQIKSSELKNKYILSLSELSKLSEDSFNAGYNFKN